MLIRAPAWTYLVLKLHPDRQDSKAEVRVGDAANGMLQNEVRYRVVLHREVDWNIGALGKEAGRG